MSINGIGWVFANPDEQVSMDLAELKTSPREGVSKKLELEESPTSVAADFLVFLEDYESPPSINKASLSKTSLMKTHHIKTRSKTKSNRDFYTNAEAKRLQVKYGLKMVELTEVKHEYNKGIRGESVREAKRRT